MKSFLVFIIVLAFSSISFSQENEETPYPRDYLGIYNGKPTYCTGLSHVRTNEISLFNIQDDQIIRVETFGLPESIFEQIFVFKNQIYALVSDRKETNYSLIKFNRIFEIEEQVKIMPYSNRLEKPGIHLSPESHTIKTIYHDGKVLLHVFNDKFHLSVIDLESMKSQHYELNLSLKGVREVSDVLFFNETDAHVILEEIGFQTHGKYLTLIDGKLNSFDLNYKQQGIGKATEYKFIQANDKNYLTSLLYKGTKLIGHTLTEIEEISISELKLNTIINDKLDNPSLWGKNNYKTWKKRGINNKYQFATLDEVLFLNNQLIFITRFHPPERPYSNVMISSLNITDDNNPTVNWNVLTQNGRYNNSMYRYNQYTHKYAICVINENTLRIYYNCDKATINEDGAVIQKKKESKRTVKAAALAIVEINLPTGAVSYLKNPYINLPKISVFIGQPHFAREGNYLYCIAEELLYHGPLVSTKERIYNYKPTLYKFPINNE